MCGILVALGDINNHKNSFLDGLKSMERRGPDFEGVLSCDSAWLGHRRLAIIDLDSRSNQPYVSYNKRYWITFNGEIYNYKILRDFLLEKDVILRTNSDTEIILELYILEGVDFLTRLEGMFAFVIWDTQSNSAFIARDAYGIKPLYYAKFNGGLLFSSQVKAILATKLVGRKLNLRAFASYWMLGSVIDHYTIYNDIEPVLAGEYLLVQDKSIVKREKWCDLGKNWLYNEKNSNVNLPRELIFNNVKNLIIESVERHIVSDVAIGIFLSGGIDSGVLAGLIKERSTSSIIGITIIFDEFLGKRADETERARIIARKFGITHHVRKVTKEEFFSDLPKIIDAMDQPTVDGVNTWYASKAAKELGLKVVLSGVGADELFFGYSHFKYLPKLVSTLRILTKSILIEKCCLIIVILISKITNNDKWSYLVDWGKTSAGAWWLSRSILTPSRVEEVMNCSLNDFKPEYLINEYCGELVSDLTLSISQLDSLMYLRNQLLKDSDWASMYHSVELRTPFVDLKLLQGLRPYLNILKDFPNKQLLYLVLEKNGLPPSIIRSRKTGFSIPINQWINDYTNSSIGWHGYIGSRFLNEDLK